MKADRRWTIRTSSEEDTIAAGIRLASKIRGVVLLIGDLGAGKTTLVRGIVSGIAGTVPDQVSSPTFTLIHDYGAGVFHIDLYRLDTPEAVESLGLGDIFDEASLVLVEWGEKLGRWLPPRRTEVTIIPGSDEERLIQIKVIGEPDAARSGPA